MSRYTPEEADAFEWYEELTHRIENRVVLAVSDTDQLADDLTLASDALVEAGICPDQAARLACHALA